MKGLNEFLNESEFTHNEKFWDRKLKVALKRFPEWADEKVDLANSIRQAYNELELDVIEGDKGYVKMPDRPRGKDWKEKSTEIYSKFITDLWAKLKGNEWAKQNALEDYLDWLK